MTCFSRRRNVRASILFTLCIALFGCGGIQTFYYYDTSSNTDSWRVDSRTLFERKTSSGKMFRYWGVEHTIDIQLDGNWSGWDMFGYLFVPFIPLKSPGEFIDISYQVSNLSDRSAVKIGKVSVLLDDNSAMQQTKLMPVGDREMSTMGVLRIERPPYVPKSIVLRFEEVNDRNKTVMIPDLILSVHTEKCYWYGDSEAHYVKCKVRAE